MIRKLLASVREYKRVSILSFLFIVGEVVIECLIPFITADLVNRLMRRSCGLHKRQGLRRIC